MKVLPFKPRINPTSEKLASQGREGSIWKNLYNLHETKSKEVEERHQEAIKERHDQEFKHCSFHPKIKPSKHLVNETPHTGSFYKRTLKWKRARDAKRQEEKA